MSSLEIRCEVEQDHGHSLGHSGTMVTFQALVDGEPMWGRDEDIACLKGFWQSLGGSGSYYLLNCNCGDFGCGGYGRPMDVTSFDHQVTVRFGSLQAEFDASQYRAAIEQSVEDARAKLPDRQASLLFACYDDAEVFGLDPSFVSEPEAVQRAVQPGGLFDRHPELMQEWLGEQQRAVMRIWSDAEREVYRRGLKPATEPGAELTQEIVREKIGAQWEIDPEDWYREQQQL